LAGPSSPTNPSEPLRSTALLRLVSAITLIGLSATTLADSPDFSLCEQVLTPYSATYVSSFRGIAMQGERTLERTGEGQFLLSHKAKAFGSHATETSRFSVVDGDFRVEQYDYLQSLLGFKKQDHARFDRQNGLIKTRYKSEKDLPLTPGILDNLSQQLAIRCDTALGNVVMDYPVVKRSGMKTYRYEQVGTETIQTDFGELDTIVLKRIQDGNKRTTQIWLAPDLNYLLVRLHQTENKDSLDLTLELADVSFQSAQ
jgi:hypothetical protein